MKKFHIKLFLILLLGFFILIAKAQNNQKIQLIINAFTYVNNVWATKGNALSEKLSQQYFTPDTTLIINGKTVYNNQSELTKHFQQVSQYIHGKFRFPLLEAVSVGNKVIVRFDEDIYDNQGIYYPAKVIAIFTVDHGKIQKWEEVANSPYFCQASANSVVYSR